MARTALETSIDSPPINAGTMPATLLSGLLLPMALAPGWLDVVSHFVPFRYLGKAVRASFVGDYWSGTVGIGALVASLSPPSP